MDADRTSEQETAKHRRIAPELWAGIVIVVVCLGACFGPKAYLHYRHERIVRDYVGRLSPNLEGLGDIDVISMLMGESWPEVDVALKRYASTSDSAAYFCGSSGQMFETRWSVMMTAADFSELAKSCPEPALPSALYDHLRCGRFLLNKAGVLSAAEPGVKSQR